MYIDSYLVYQRGGASGQKEKHLPNKVRSCNIMEKIFLFYISFGKQLLSWQIVTVKLHSDCEEDPLQWFPCVGIAAVPGGGRKELEHSSASGLLEQNHLSDFPAAVLAACLYPWVLPRYQQVRPWHDVSSTATRWMPMRPSNSFTKRMAFLSVL